MKNKENVEAALKSAISSALDAHIKRDGTLKTLDWFNCSNETTDRYISQLKG